MIEKSEVYPTTRPIFDSNQIKDVSQLEKGNYYKSMRKVRGEIKEMDCFEFLEHAKKGWMKIKTRFGEEKVSLADCGINSYSAGVWNPTNYVIPA